MYNQSCSTSDPKRSWSLKIDQIENVTVKKTLAGFSLSLGFVCKWVSAKNVIYLIQRHLCNLQYIGETKRRLKDRFNEHRRPIFNPIGNYIHTAVPEPVIIPTIICFWFLLKNSEMRVILSGKHLKPTLSIKLRQLSLWASINVMNCNYIVFLSSHTIPRHI